MTSLPHTCRGGMCLLSCKGEEHSWHERDEDFEAEKAMVSCFQKHKEGKNFLNASGNY